METLKIRINGWRGIYATKEGNKDRQSEA
jgi:hypothetical protein